MNFETPIVFCLKYREVDVQSQNAWTDGTVDPKTKLLHSGLFNSAKMVVDMLNAQGIEAHMESVIDNNHIYKMINKHKAKTVVIEAFFVVPEKFDELIPLYPDVKWIIRNHSETPFLANEGMAFDWTLRYLSKPNVYMSCNAPRMVEETRFLAARAFPEWSKEMVEERVPYLPNYYPLPDQISTKKVDKDSDTIHIGCFGAIRPLKNQVIQAISAIKFAHSVGKKLKFHINSTRIEQNGSPVIRNLRGIFDKYDDYELVEEPWRSHDDFREVMAGMDILSQVSFTETFNIVAADAVCMGVPIVTSNEISWASSIFYADPTNSNSIANAMKRAYTINSLFPKFNPAVKGLKMYNKKSIKLWTKCFKYRNFLYYV